VGVGRAGKRPGPLGVRSVRATAAPHGSGPRAPWRGQTEDLDGGIVIVPAELAFVGDRDRPPVHPALEILGYRSRLGPEPILRVDDDRLGQARVLHVSVRAGEVDLGEVRWVERADVQHGLALRPESDYLGDMGKRADEAETLDARSLQPDQHGVPLPTALLPLVPVGVPTPGDVDEVDLEDVGAVLVDGAPRGPRGVALAGVDRAHGL